MSFDIRQSLLRIGIESVNKMQEDMLGAWPSFKDMVLLSPTGSGKTLAFLLPLLGDLDLMDDDVQAIILSPSRELALQIESVAKSLQTGLRIQSLYGGRPTMVEHQKMMDFRPQVLVATPGRLLDHMGKENFKLSSRRFLVIDEFDKSLELGFQEDMSRIMKRLGTLERRVLLSATDMADIPSFLYPDGKKGKLIRLDYTDQRKKKGFEVYKVDCPEKDKMEACLRLLKSLGDTSSIVFLGYRESVERFSQFLRKSGFPYSMYHGALEQEDRERNLYRFRSGSSLCLVSTDLAARGLDIDGVDQVIHYHLPLTEEVYTHRNGRTARYGAEGKAYLLIGPEEHVPSFLQENMPSYRIPEGEYAIPEPRYQSLYIGRGKKDKLSKGDVVGFLCKNAGLTASEIGRIDVMDHCCYVCVPRATWKQVVAKVKDLKIKGMKTRIEAAY